ncbi:MAG: S-layer homology domain-containing protein [Ruminococcaceae bacterium]|nr:S-layer homology domain-containing protein [Oscillospiraceae bacterium]
MKKIIMLVLISTCISMLLCSIVGAAVFNVKFDDEESVSSWINTKHELDFSFDEINKALKIVTKGVDPYFSHRFADGINASVYKYVYYRFKITDGANHAQNGQFFIDKSDITMGTSGTYTSFSIDNTAEWQDVCVDLSELTAWNGIINGFRIDPVHQGEFNAVTFLVDTVAFCSTSEEAEFLKSECKEMNGGLKWTFDSYENFKRHIHNLASIDYNSENGYVVLTPEGADPMLGIMLTESEKFTAEEFPYVAFRMRAHTTFDFGSVLFSTDKYSMAHTRVNFKVIGDGEWHNYIINMEDAHEYWDGTIKELRFDFIDHMSDGKNPLEEHLKSKIVVDRIGVLTSYDDAVGFLNKELVCNVKFPFDEYINTGAETPVWDFHNDTNISSKWHIGQGSFFREHGLCGIIASSTDMTLTSQFTEEDCFSADEFKFFGIRVKNISTKKTGGMFFKNDVDIFDFADSDFSNFNYKTDGEWENIIVNNKKRFPNTWTGNITSVRLDLLNPSYGDAVIYISRAGFFRSEAEALEYLNAAVDTPDYSQPAVFKDAYQRVYIPGGTLSEGYSKSNYMLSSASSLGEGNEQLVIYTDNSGCNSVVALSDVNSAGFARFVSQKPGIYTIGNNTRTFSDISDHWAESQINYVARRDILLGTSCDKFAPDMPLTRGMFVAALGRMHGIDNTTNDFTNVTIPDVDNTTYYAPYAVWALNNNIISLRENNSFMPEEPITRAETVTAISNYASVYGFNHLFYNDTSEFTDIDEHCPDGFEASLNKLQRWGIIEGINDTQFDPNGILTRAEVSVIFKNLIKSLTGSAIIDSKFTNEEITKKRLRLGVWGFAFSEKEEVDRLKELGVNLICSGSGVNNEIVWDLCDKYGIEIMMQDYPLAGTPVIENGKTKLDENGYVYKQYTPVDLDTLIAEYAEHPSFGGHYFIDEPGTFEMPWIGDAIKEYNKRFPNKKAFVNLLPMYANAAQLKYNAGADKIDYYDPDPDLYRKYCQTWFETSGASYICTDIYPLNWLDGIKDNAHKHTYRDYVESINQIATVARENNAEFWCCIQTHAWTSTKRTPNEAEFRWQAYSMLSFGATGILLWSYTSGNLAYPSMIDIPTRKVNQSYYDCQKVFKELNAISDVYITYRNLGAFTHNASETVPYLLMSDGTEYDKTKTVFSDIQCDNPLLFGYFVKDVDGTNAFTVVNMTEFSGNKSSVVKFKLDDSAGEVVSYYRGVPTVLTAVDGYYTLDLECGDGVFVTVDVKTACL